MGTTMDQNLGTVAIPEATAEAKTLIEDLSRLGEELKLRQERLGELLAPSEAALPRTEYLDKVTREHLGRAEQRVLKLSEEVQRIARSLNDHVIQMPARLAEAEARRWAARERRERWRMVVSLLAMLLGGFLAGQIASYRSGAVANGRTSTIEAKTKATKSTPAAPRRPATKPNAAPAR
jgi:chromosome segregation ATPase